MFLRVQQEPEYLRGTVETVTFQNEENGFAVLTLQDEEGELICAVGPLAGSTPGEQLTLVGNYAQHGTYGRQFQATGCTHRLPETDTAIRQYLSSGVLPGIGKAFANRIVDRFGHESLEILASDPERLTEVRGITRAKALEAGRRFMELFGAREAMASLASLGLAAGEALALYRQFGDASLTAVKQNPYLLCEYPLYLGFTRVDEIAGRLSVEHEGPERLQAALMYTLRHNLQNGHTCLPKEKLLQTASRFFLVEPERFDIELEKMCENGGLQVVEYESASFVYLKDTLRAELNAAMRIKGLASIKEFEATGIEKQISLRETAEGIEYAPLQKQAIAEALRRRVLVITGGPGTGKTTTINAIISLYEQRADRVLLAAPTGRAAKRLSELTGRQASTIHRLLEVSYVPGSDVPRFNKNEQNPLRCDVLIVDEMSMVDAMLFESLLVALRPTCRLIMVGDTDQLPSVGPGNVLRGIIDSGMVPVVQLNEIFRQAASSLIVSNAHRIVEGGMPQKGGKEDDFFFIKSYGSHCAKLTADLVARRLPESYGFSAQEDIQILCPGRKGPLGTEALNLRMQELLNPAQPEKKELRTAGVTFREGDKVMQVKNNYDIPFTRSDGEAGAGAFNGDIGFVEEINPSTGSLTVFCEDRHVYYTTETVHQLELAYAVTIHKSQGSEFEAVVLPLAETPQKLRYRNLLYTGVTRAKKLCVIAGEESVLEEMVRRGRRNVRYSCFSNFLKDDSLI